MEEDYIAPFDRKIFNLITQVCRIKTIVVIKDLIHKSKYFLNYQLEFPGFNKKMIF